jgi:HD-GYP domain-containing protein (c-di-GMP phosphodiesterase class II)/methanogenic corrinoid protein MtbC1
VSGATQVSFRRPPRRGTSRPHPSASGSASERSNEAVHSSQELHLGTAQAEAGASEAPLQGPAGPQSGRSRLHSALWAALAVAGGVGAIAAGDSVLVAVAVLVSAGAAVALGWNLGEHRRAALSREIEGSSTKLKRALSELEIAQAETVRRLSMAVEFRDEGTGAHIERIGRFSTMLAEQIGMDQEFCERLTHAAPLHDVGKVAIPDSILLKPGPLTAEERAIVETHAEEGYRLVRGSSSSILDMAATIALSHQEKWDGSGYPRGLAGEAIPIEGRIVAVADVFDALTSDRAYRKAFSVDEAVQMMREQRGKHFDPVLLDAFMEVLGRSGPDARPETDPLALAETTLETYASAIERGDAEMAENAIVTAVEEGISPTTLHGEVIAPALRRLDRLARTGELDPDRRRVATGITKRVLATLYRYMLGGTEATRERVLLAGMEGDDHTLGLQMMHDQLAAAGYRTIFETDLSADHLRDAVESQSPDLIIVGATSPASAAAVERALKDMRAGHPEMPVVLGGIAVGGEVPGDQGSLRVLERIDESVEAVEELLSARASVA